MELKIVVYRVNREVLTNTIESLRALLSEVHPSDHEFRYTKINRNPVYCDVCGWAQLTKSSTIGRYAERSMILHRIEQLKKMLDRAYDSHFEYSLYCQMEFVYPKPTVPFVPLVIPGNRYGLYIIPYFITLNQVRAIRSLTNKSSRPRHPEDHDYVEDPANPGVCAHCLWTDHTVSLGFGKSSVQDWTRTTNKVVADEYTNMRKLQVNIGQLLSIGWDESVQRRVISLCH